MLMTLIQKEMMHHILSVPVHCAPANVCAAHPTHPFDQLSQV